MFKDKNYILWVFPIEPSPHKGGGVGTALQSLIRLKIFGEKKYKIRKLYNKSKFYNICNVFSDVFIKKHEKFVLHSLFNIYSLILITISRRKKILIFSHGELTSGALNLKSLNKKIILSILKYLQNISKHEITLACTNNGEIENLRKSLILKNAIIASDIVSEKLLLNNKKNIKKNEKINAILISRVVKNKGISFFLRSLLNKKINEKPSKFIENIGAIHLFLSLEDEDELEKIIDLESEICQLFEIKVNIYYNYTHTQIRETLNKICNKQPIIPSEFESFCYVLIELLGCEFIPIVWFENELVNELQILKLCIKCEQGELPVNNILNYDENVVCSFFEEKDKETKQIYKNIVKKVF